MTTSIENYVAFHWMSCDLKNTHIIENKWDSALRCSWKLVRICNITIGAVEILIGSITFLILQFLYSIRHGPYYCAIFFRPSSQLLENGFLVDSYPLCNRWPISHYWTQSLDSLRYRVWVHYTPITVSLFSLLIAPSLDILGVRSQPHINYSFDFSSHVWDRLTLISSYSHNFLQICMESRFGASYLGRGGGELSAHPWRHLRTGPILAIKHVNVLRPKPRKNRG